MKFTEKSDYINSTSDFYPFSIQGDFLIPKGLNQKDVMNLSSIITSSIFNIETYLQRFENIPFNELMPEDKERYKALQKTLETEKQELEALKVAYQEFFI